MSTHPSLRSRWLGRFLLLGCLLWLPLAAAVGTGEVLSLQNRPVHTFRASLGAMTAQERAARATERIRGLSKTELLTPVEAHASGEGMLLTVAGHPLFAVLPGDLEPGVDGSLALEAERIRGGLQEALRAEAEQRDVRRFLKAGLQALATTAGLVLAFLLLRRLRTAAVPWVVRLGESIPRLAVGSLVLVDGRRARRVLGGLLVLIHVSLQGLLAYGWITYVLGRFPATRPFAQAMAASLGEVVGKVLGSILGALPGLVAGGLILLAARLAVRLVAAFFENLARSESSVGWLHPETAEPTRRIVTAIIWVFALVMVHPYLPGSDSLAFKGMSVFLGVLVSLGSSGIMNQVMSGMVLMYSRAFKVGDVVRIGDAEGVVAELGLLSTRLRIRRQEEVTLPNAVVLASSIRNFSRPGGEQGQVLQTSVTIGYDAPWRQVHALLLKAAGQTAGIQTQPAPFVLQTALQDHYVEYQLHVRVEDPEQRFMVLSALHGEIQDAFNDAGVQIMSPHYIADKAEPVVVPREHWFPRSEVP